MSKLGACCTAH